MDWFQGPTFDSKPNNALIENWKLKKIFLMP